MNQSDSIAELADALAKAQAEIRGAVKDSTNPHFKSKYADLASVWDAWQKAGPKNGLAITQTFGVIDGVVLLYTQLTHKSGQWIRSAYPVDPQQRTPQGYGSAATYARRYSLAAMVGVAPEDDDGEAAMQRNGAASPPPVPAVNKALDFTADQRREAAEEWANQVVDLFRDSSPDEINTWHANTRNRGALSKLEKNHPDLHARILQAMNADRRAA